MTQTRAPRKKTVAARKIRRVSPAKSERTYQVILRTDGATITASGGDRGLYPRAVAWNRILSSDQGRQSNAEQERESWRVNGRQTFLDLARTGNISPSDAAAFIDAAAASGRVQVELEWESEDFGYAARIFPWEAIIALATKPQREAAGDKDLVVVRWLKGLQPRPAAEGPAGFVVSPAAEKLGFSTGTERAAIAEALRGKLELIDLPAKSLIQLSRSIKDAAKAPSIIHYILSTAKEGAGDGEDNLEAIAQTVAQASPQLVAFSTCLSGRRLAPLAIAHGAHLAIGFHGWVSDARCPAFFGAFYRAWQRETASPLEALREVLAANRREPNADDLGVVTLWSAHDLLAAPRVQAARGSARAGGAKASASAAGGKKSTNGTAPPETPLVFDCDLEPSLNYSMLHNNRRLRPDAACSGQEPVAERSNDGGGIFTRFCVTKLTPGKMDDLEVSVKFDNGFERTVESHFFVPLREEANSVASLAPYVVLPLGSELLRRRGEMIRGTVEIVIRCSGKQVFHKFDSIQLPPCDEWKDDEVGRRFLPSFVFPRDPAVRDILTAAQPFLRALTDDPIAGFDGYQRGFVGEGVEAVRWQLRAIWTALQTTHRLDYVNPPPSYIRGVQRLRTPEEVLRAQRGTCIELALLLAACWEHIGIYPVLLLIPGHAFTGYWASEEAWRAFFEKFVERATSLQPGNIGIDDGEDISRGKKIDPSKMAGGGTISKDQPWVLKGLHHLALIHREVAEKRLIPVEATAVALQKSFGTAEREGTDLLRNLRRFEDFDAMIDGQKARQEGVTPLAILTQNAVA